MLGRRVELRAMSGYFLLRKKSGRRRGVRRRENLMAKKPPFEGWRDKEHYKYRKTFRGKDSQGRWELQFKRRRLRNVSVV